MRRAERNPPAKVWQPSRDKKKEEDLIRTVLAERGSANGQPPRGKFALRGLESLVACVLVGGSGEASSGR